MPFLKHALHVPKPPESELCDFDYVLAGGGLQAGLLVLAIRHYQPSARILVVERGAKFGGNHTWSFHGQDIPRSAAAWVDQLPTHRWDSYQVKFPRYTGTVQREYASTASAELAESVKRTLKADDSGSLLMNTEVESLGQTYLHTTRGHRISGRCVIDCRGLNSGADRSACASASQLLDCGFQKFVGVEIELTEDWPSRTPMLMDACVDQADGFHFVYVLPFTPRRVLVEDTWFSDNSQLDVEASAKRLRRYIAQQTHAGWNSLRLERGCLPMPLKGLTPRAVSTPLNSDALAGGYAGGWFHAATGYSFPLAVRFADAVARSRPEAAAAAIEDLRRKNQFQFRFSRFLNRLLFRLVRPDTRWQVFERLYRSVGADTLSRFYAHEFSAADAFRMVAGFPPSKLTPLKFIRGFQTDLQAFRSNQLGTSV